MDDTALDEDGHDALLDDDSTGETSVGGHASDAVLIRRLTVQGLFGRRSFELRLPDSASPRRLVLLYGDNGSGKTTLLRCIWHLLSPAGNRGHRTALREVNFKVLEAELSSGDVIRAEKSHPAASAMLIQVLRPDGSVMINSEWGPDESIFRGWDLDSLRAELQSLPEELRRSAEGFLAQDRYIEYVKSLGGSPYFLADDRGFYSDDLPDEDRASARPQRPAEGRRETTPAVAKELASSLRRATEYLRRLAVGGTTSGSVTTNSVYLEVLKQLAQSDLGESAASPDATARLVEQMQTLDERSVSYESIGLVPRFASDEFISVIDEIPTERWMIAEGILAPFLASYEARLQALMPAEQLISTFLREANGFLTGKKLTFDQRQGIRIRLDSGEALSPADLSSGERQLVLLLCNALLARRGAKLFIVDEPEISLNAKWQRKIVQALLACTEGAPVQFLIATHSIEVLSAYRANIIELA